MSLRIVVEKENISVKKGTSAKTGKPYEIREQQVIVYGIGRFPLETKIALPDNCEGYKAGEYDVTSPLTVGRFGFEVPRDLGLAPVKAAKAA